MKLSAGSHIDCYISIIFRLSCGGRMTYKNKVREIHYVCAEVVVRLSLGLEVVQSGGEPVIEPLYWPVYFAVDDLALRFLAGDVASADWLHAPGPLVRGVAPSWRRDVAARGITGPSYVG